MLYFSVILLLATSGSLFLQGGDAKFLITSMFIPSLYTHLKKVNDNKVNLALFTEASGYIGESLHLCLTSKVQQHIKAIIEISHDPQYCFYYINVNYVR